MSQELLMECAYDWGKVFRIYRDSVQIHDTTYALSDLLSVQPTYHRFMGVSSARLVLSFTQQTVTLRGIAEVDALRQAVVFLDACALHHDSAIEPITEYMPSLRDAYNPYKEQVEDLSQAPTRPVATPAKLRQYPSQESEVKQQRRTCELHIRNLREGRSQREHRADVKLLVQRFQEQPLPTVPVPLRLQRNEYALYTIPATLYQEVSRNERQGTSNPKDQGMLIFTTRRLIYLGRTNQLITDYVRLLRFSYQQDSITISTEHWLLGNIFRVRRPLECSVYLEAIMECFREEWATLPADDEVYETPTRAILDERHLVELYTHANVANVAQSAAMASIPTAPVALSPIVVTDWKVAQ